MEEPAASESNGRTTVFDRLVEAHAAVRRNLTGKKFVGEFTDDSKHKRQTFLRNKFVAGARRGLHRTRHRLGVGAQRLSQKIRQIIRPLEMLQFVAILFINVAHGLSSTAFATDFDAFSVFRDCEGHSKNTLSPQKKFAKRDRLTLSSLPSSLASSPFTHDRSRVLTPRRSPCTTSR